MDSSDSRATLLHPQDDRLQSLRKRNRTIILIFFSLIILLALLLSGIIISLIPNYISQPDPLTPNPAIREFCSPSHPHFFCVSTLSSFINTPPKTTPNQIFLLSLQASLKHLSKIASMAANPTRPEPNCSARATGLIGDVLGIVRVNPNVETWSYQQRDEMVERFDAAVDALASCAVDLRELQSTAVDGVRYKVVHEVNEVDRIVRYSREFLVNCDSVNENFRWPLANEDNARNQIVEDLIAVTLFGSQYFVLVFLFCLLLRFYR